MADGELVVIDAELEPIEPPPPTPVDLDAVIDAESVDETRNAAAEPDIVDAEVVPFSDWVSPLADNPDQPRLIPHKLSGGVVTEPAAVEVISRSIDYALLPAWRRLFTRRPAGYTTPLTDWWKL